MKCWKYQLHYAVDILSLNYILCCKILKCTDFVRISTLTTTIVNYDNPALQVLDLTKSIRVDRPNHRQFRVSGDKPNMQRLFLNNKVSRVFGSEPNNAHKLKLLKILEYITAITH